VLESKIEMLIWRVHSIRLFPEFFEHHNPQPSAPMFPFSLLFFISGQQTDLKIVKICR
jgi:hypothetical protein